DPFAHGQLCGRADDAVVRPDNGVTSSQCILRRQRLQPASQALEARPLALDKQSRRSAESLPIADERAAGALDCRCSAAGEGGAGGVEALSELALVWNHESRSR